MIITLLFVGFVKPQAIALPTLTSVNITLDSTPLFLARDAAESLCSCNCSGRTTFTIIQSCIFTIAACVYKAIHPNIPNPKASTWRVMWERTVITFYMLFFSEFVMMWAIRQWFGARLIVNAFQSHGLEWTSVHGHFVQMGGFGRADNKHVLYHLELLELLNDGKVSLESLKISKQDLEDHSKEDFLSKAVATLQTSWFVVQCIARLADKLALTELEVVTLAFAMLNVVTYIAWWNKPLAVRSMIYLTIMESNPEVASQSESVPNTPPSLLQPTVTTLTPIGRLMTGFKDEWNSIWSFYERYVQNVVEAKSLTLRFKALVLLGGITLIFALSGLFLLFASSILIIIVGIPVFMIYAIIAATQGLLHLTIANPVFESGQGYLSYFVERRHPSHVPRFNRLNLGGTALGYSASWSVLIGTIFGAIHFTAWDNHSVGHKDKLVWRIATIYITVIPSICLMVASTVRFSKGRGHGLPVRGTLVVGVFFIVAMIGYFIARFAILVEALITLRDLPPGAFVDIDWIQLVPHL